MARVGAIPWLVGSAGVALVWAAVANKSPLDLMRSVLGAGAGDVGRIDPGNRYAGGLTAAPGAPGAPAGGLAPIVGNIPRASLSASQESELLDLNEQPGQRLWRPAAASFHLWEYSFGSHIWLIAGSGSSYRSTAQQAESYRNAVANGEPDRFAEPGHSWHERGLAVDIDIGRTCGPNEQPGTAKYDRMRSIGEGLGWCFPRAKPRGDGKEPWHASYGGCG